MQPITPTTVIRLVSILDNGISSAIAFSLSITGLLNDTYSSYCKLDVLEVFRGHGRDSPCLMTMKVFPLPHAVTSLVVK